MINILISSGRITTQQTRQSRRRLAASFGRYGSFTLRADGSGRHIVRAQTDKSKGQFVSELISEWLLTSKTNTNDI